MHYLDGPKKNVLKEILGIKKSHDEQRFISDLKLRQYNIAIVVYPCILKEFNYTPKPYLKPYMEL